MGLTANELAGINDDHFQKLIDEDSELYDHADGIQELDENQQKNLAYKLVLQCPEQQFQNFFHQIESFKNNTDMAAFYKVLSECYHIRGVFKMLADPRVTNPQERLMSDDLDPNLINRHEGFRDDYLAEFGDKISLRLAETMSTSEYAQKEQRIKALFSGEFVVHLERGLNIRFAVETQLLGEEPALFFEAVDIDACHEFRGLIAKLVQGNEEQIAEGLGRAERNRHHSISRMLENLCQTLENESPLRKIQALFSSRAEKIQQEQRSTQEPLSDNPSTLFGGGKKENPKKEPQEPKEKQKEPTDNGNKKPQQPPVPSDDCCSTLLKCTIM